MKKPQCSKCHRPLTDPYSIAVMMGPECRGSASKGGRKFPKAKWKVQGGRMVFDGLATAVEAPTVKTSKRMDGKQKLVRSTLEHGGLPSDAAGLLQEYMEEHDSFVTMQWCNWYVRKVMQEMAKEKKR
jgi:hypothetical protein